MGDLPKIVQERLRATPLPGAAEHPDADLLTAFVEQALSANEREAVLKHLVFCGDCREVVALTRPEGTEDASLLAVKRPETVLVRAKSEGSWLAWPRLRWAALAAGAVVASTVLLLHPGKPNAATDAKQPVSTKPPGTTAGQQAPAPADSEIASAKEKMERLAPRSRELEIDKAAGRQNEAPAPVPPADDTWKTQKTPPSADEPAKGLFGLPTSGPSTATHARKQEIGSHPRRDAGSLVDLRQAPAPGESAAGVGLAASNGPPRTFSEEGYRNRPEDRGTNAYAARSSLTVETGVAVEKEKVGSEKKDEIAKAVPGAQGQPQTPPPPIPSAHETVTVTSQSVSVDTVGRAAASPVSDPLAVSKAKQSVGNKGEASMPRRDTETSAAADGLIATQATHSTNGRSVMSLVQLPPQWRILAGALQRSLNSGVNWETVFHADRALLCYASTANDVWTGGKKGALFRSRDGGATWTQISPSANGSPLSSDVIQIVARSAAEIVVSTSQSETWTTSDGGKTWAKK